MAKLGTCQTLHWVPKSGEVPPEDLLDDVNTALGTIPTASTRETTELVNSTALKILEMISKG